MSLDAVQLNKRIGLGQSSFGSPKVGGGASAKTTGLSAQATKNLSGASLANKPSVFSFTQQSGYHRVYGNNTAKNKTQLNLERRHAANNARNQGVRTSADYTNIGFVQAAPQQPHMSTLGQIGLGIQKGFQAFQLGYQIFGGANNGTKINQGMSTLGNSGSQVQMSSSAGQSAIAGMQNAQTSAELSSAIGSAQTQWAQLNKAATLSDFEGKANTAKENLSTYKENTTKTQSALKDASQGVKTSREGVRAASDMRDNCLNQVKKADSQYGAALEAHSNAKAGLTQANQDLSNAKAVLAATPETIQDANGNPIPNPKRKAAEQAVEKAETAQKNAQAAEEKAKQALNEADNARDKSNAALNDAKAKYDKQDSLLDKAKEQETTSEKKYFEALKENKKAEEAYQTAQNDMQIYQNYQHDAKQLQSEITKQQERLEKLQKKEEKQINKLNKKIDKGIQKNFKSNEGIDPSNGMNIRERYLQNNIERRNDKNAARIAQRDAIIAKHV